MNHYCTYFDRAFLIQGMALAASLRRHDPVGVLWVLCLDETTRTVVDGARDDRMRAVSLATLEGADQELLSVKSHRSKVEYFFTLSPCWPNFLLQSHPEIDRLTYVDADLFFFSDPAPIFTEMDAASVLVTEHRHPAHLAHHRRYGRFNVGLLSFCNDGTGRACLTWWREQCIEWCYDRVEAQRYADQKYLDQWPDRYGGRLCVLSRRGVNLAPWNWSQYRYIINADQLMVENELLEVFHFARFRPALGDWWFQSGQLEYGVMPWTLRQWIYGRYWVALKHARAQIREQLPDFNFPSRSARRWHGFWRALLPRFLFGSDWLQINVYFISGRLGLGRFSGRLLSWARGRLLRRLRRSVAEKVPVEPPCRTASS